jgi:hypothetical protein
MRKQNSLSYETVKAIFDPFSESEAGGSYFKISGSSAVKVDIPTSIMHRIFRLGQAYGMRQLRYFESDVKVVVGSVEIPEFIDDLKRLAALVNDEVLRDYIDVLLSALASPPGAAGISVAVSTGSYFEKRDR